MRSSTDYATCVTGEHRHRTEGGWRRCSRAYDAMVRRAERRAAKIGREHGEDAAAWWEQDAIGGRATGDVTEAARRILAGIEEGDPEIMDGLPTADLSGEWADGYTPDQLADDCGVPIPRDAAPNDPAWALVEFQNELCNIYEEAFDSAAINVVGRACRAVVSRTETRGEQS